MTESYPFWSLVKHELSLRRDRRADGHLSLRRWSISIPSFVVWFVVVTWQGHNIHFNLNDAWYATLALPIMAMGVATRHISQERRNSTMGWWLALPMPRYQLLLSKWIASLILMIRRSTYLGVIAVLGPYTMMLNGTFSSEALFHFWLTGLSWTLLMYCLVPPLASVGVLAGVLRFSRLKDLGGALWLLLVAIGWLPVSHPKLYVTVSPTLSLTVKPTFALAMLATWLLGAILFGLSSRILSRTTGL